MREIEAFSYWPDHASAIRGFGGHRMSPDPRYCFHTLYNDVQAGPARYVLRLRQARASVGELTLRVHAFRPPHDTQISLVAGGRLLLNEVASGDLAVEVPFVALRGVVYAFYGYFSEDTDIQAGHVGVELVESEGGAEAHFVEPPRSALAPADSRAEVRPANALIHAGKVSLGAPVSQECTVAQISAIGRQGGERGDIAARLAQWREVVCLAALDAYGVNLAGLDGLVIGPAGEGVRAPLGRGHFVVTYADKVPEEAVDGDFCDFLLWPHAAGVADASDERWQQVRTVLGRLKIGGLGVIGLTYRQPDALISSSHAARDEALSRNEVGQWALRLIGQGYSVAPMAFAPFADAVPDGEGQVSCTLIVKRL
ncbi:MAG TPA: hypothetical protein VN222_08175 [Novosphingobium sp.]|nr:hypothetical protein [Novosphingobium sp.]